MTKEQERTLKQRRTQLRARETRQRLTLMLLGTAVEFVRESDEILESARGIVGFDHSVKKAMIHEALETAIKAWEG